jgi:hypothetical protein
MKFLTGIIRVVQHRLGRIVAGSPFLDSAKQTREREVDRIVTRFRKQLGPIRESPWEALEAMYDDRGLPR